MFNAKQWTVYLVLALMLIAYWTQLIAQEEPYALVIDPANFVEGVDNPYFPLTPGTRHIYEGETEEGTIERIEVSVTYETRQILGVTCVVVRDTVWDDGEMIEDTFDWYAQDLDGNVWYMGEDSKQYEGGEVVSTASSWEAGVDGAQPGIIMWADPQVGEVYRQEYYVGEAEDMAEVISVSESAEVSHGAFADLLMTKEWAPLDPDVAEHKYYAAGIGLVWEVVVEGGSGEIGLIDVVTEDCEGDDDDSGDADDDQEMGDVECGHQSDMDDADDDGDSDDDNDGDSDEDDD